MKVIEQGKIPEDKTIQRTCGNCQSVLEWQQSEACPSPDPRDRGVYQVVCPVCEKPVEYSL